jgi:hypothetical protein
MFCRKIARFFFLGRRLSAYILLISIIHGAHAQVVTIAGNTTFWVAGNQVIHAPDGYLLRDKAIQVLPSMMVLDEGDVILAEPSATYKVYSVLPSSDATFYSAVVDGKAGFKVRNSSSSVSVFALRLHVDTQLGQTSIPVLWEVTQTTGTGVGDMVFSWDNSLEPALLPNKRLYVQDSTGWRVLPDANTVSGNKSLVYSGYNSSLSGTLFGIATGLSIIVTKTNISCGGAPGTISITANGGLGARSYKIGNGTWQSSNQFTGLAAGTYIVYVRDSSGDVKSDTLEIIGSNMATASVTGNTKICKGESTTLNASGGSYYLWSDGSTATSRNLYLSCSATYSLTVTNADGCQASTVVSITVTEPPLVEQLSPISGNSGDIIHIYGTGLDAISGVSVNGLPVADLTIVSAELVNVGLPFSGFVQHINLITSCGNYTIDDTPPVINSFSPGAGSAGTIITLTGTHLDQLVSASIGNVDAVILSKAASTARIMVMPGTISGSLTVSSAISTTTSAAAFTLTPTPYPYFQQGPKRGVNNPDGALGASVSVSADGNTAVIGAPGENGGVGVACVYARNSTNWSLQSVLVSTGGVGQTRFGSSVSISSDGNKVAVGGPGDNSGIGAVWIFVRNGVNWLQQGNKLVGSGAVGTAQQGTQVALSGDGRTLASGGVADNAYEGAVWTFTEVESSWTQFDNKVVGTGMTGKARQGASVALSADGTRLVSGGYQDNNRQGAVWIFEKANCSWNQMGGKLIGTGGSTQAWQGYSVSINADGNLLLAGGCTDTQLSGASWVFSLLNGNWTQQARLIGANSAGAARQGSSVAVSADGKTLVTGGMADDSNKGAVWVYKRIDNNWIQQGGKIKGSSAIGAARQGTSVSLSSNGNTALIGGPADAVNKGAFWVYVPATVIPSAQKPTRIDRTVAAGILRLDQNIPNPFSTHTSINFCIPGACNVTWEISDASGSVIWKTDKSYPAGENSESFNLDCRPGVLWYRLVTPFGVLSGKMIQITGE